jgi:hypothetical protein
LSRHICYIINAANDLGYNAVIDMARRCTDCKIGRQYSLHKDGLAIDLLIYDSNGDYLPKGEIYSKLHDLWDEFGGAKRIKGDLGHFSIAHRGMR